MKLQDIENNPLVKIKKENGYLIAKYSRHCFFDNTWDEASINSRGHIYDSKTGKLVVRTFHKMFNYGENKTEFTTNGPYFVQLKINGFMGAVTNNNGTLIYSTTGSTTSDYAKWLQREVEKIDGLSESFIPGFTYLFEVCIPEDPHIIPEVYGLYFLSRIDIQSGIYHSRPKELIKFDIFVPFAIFKSKEEVLALKNKKMVEGYVVWENFKPSFKIKTNDYLISKFIARANKEKRERIYDNKINKFTVFDDEEMIPVINWIVSNFSKEEFINMSEQDVLIQLRNAIDDNANFHIKS